ncbi:DUF6122 family protein [Sphingobacterium griseoflavum]|uniref:Metal-dependent hydrolase n=1 Tax=Sphingobacterium griseoflavum TaxID=1474952 RepID=A0ABQ3HSS2_9SPHI|nr:DUF6122 family protein [Sphingobacterium griseoflavum]GHE31110.1 hypothetical protein GCM10017764_12710 [Sphingobacterium griseoflavum]
MEASAIVQTGIHYGLHFLAPAGIAYIFYRDRWKAVWLILLGTMLVDLDHLLADPIFDPGRCSVGFHLLHSYVAIVAYALVFLVAKRGSILHIVSVGLLFHMLTDFIDCQMGTLL